MYLNLFKFEFCKSFIIKQFKKKFPNIKIEVFWDYPYP